MRTKRVGIVLTAVVLTFFCFRTAAADELSDVKAQMQLMQEQMKVLVNRIDVLEKEKSTAVAAAGTVPAGIEERVDALEGRLKNPLLKKISDGDFKISGFMQAYYRWQEHNSGDDKFDIRRAFLTFDAKFADDFLGRVQMDAGASSDILRDAWIKYKGIPYANLKFGQFATPFSYEWNISSAALDTIERAKVTTSLAHKRDIGVMVDGNVLDDKLYYAFGIFNGTKKNQSEDNDDKDVITRILVSPFKGGQNDFLEGITFGVAYQLGEQNPSTVNVGRRERLGGVIVYKYEKLKIYSEYLYQAMEQTDDTTKYSDGWYITGTYKILPELQGVVKYEQYDPNKEVSRDRQDVFTLGGIYFFNKNVKLEANYRQKFEQKSNKDTNNEFIIQTQVKF